MKKLYIDVDGVLLGKNDPDNIEVVLARHAEEFLRFCLKSYDCYWLTTHCTEGNNANVIRWLKKYAGDTIIELVKGIKPTTWRTFKTEAIDFSSQFFWIDDEPLQHEKNILEKNNSFGRWIKVDTCKDPDDLKRAMEILREEL